MLNIFNQFLQEIHNIVIKAYGENCDTKSIVVEYPRNRAYGDLSTNAAIILAKQLKLSSKIIAEMLVSELSKNQDIVKCEIAGAGFINITLAIDFWHKQLSKVLEQGTSYGKCNVGRGRKVNIEFVSANPTGPMHIGHSRGAIYGDALANLLEFAGFYVTKEFYINDYGNQIVTLAASAFIRYKQALGIDEAIPDGHYPGDYLITVGKALKAQYGDKLLNMEESSRQEIVSKFTVDSMIELIKKDLRSLGVEHDTFTSEKFDIVAHSKHEEAFELLKSKGLIYKGILDVPKGKVPEDWEPREQELFKSTEFGDDIDRPLKKSDDNFTYLAGDIAYHLDKLQRGFDELILVLGADHIGYVKRIKAAVKALSDNKVNLDVRINQLVNLLKDGNPYKMSKRAGNFITVQNMLDEVGKDILRFVMLSRKADTVLDLDFTKVKEQSKDNPVFYVQYAHTRACSVLRKASELGLEFNKTNIDFSFLKHEAEINLIKQILLFPKVVEAAASAHEPHRIAFYLYDLANELHILWAKGSEHEDLRFIIPDNTSLTHARLGLIFAAKTTLCIGLNLLKVAALETM